MIKIYPGTQNYVKTSSLAMFMSMMPLKTTTINCIGSTCKAASRITDIAEFSSQAQNSNTLMNAFGTMLAQAPKKTGKSVQVPLPSVDMDISKTKYEGDPLFLNQFLKGVLKGKGRAFYKAQNKYGINATFLIGIANHESGNGTSEFARKYNNVGGMIYKKSPIKFKSVAESIDSIASNIKNNYVAKGMRTPAQIGKKYAKDPKWPQKIVKHMKKIYNNK